MPSFKKIYPFVFGLALTGYTVYSALDTFVITRSYHTAEVNNSFVFVTQPAASESAVQTETENTRASEQFTTETSPVTSVSALSSESITGVTSQSAVSDSAVSGSASSAVVTVAKKPPVVVKNDENTEKTDEEKHEEVTEAPPSEIPEETQPPETEPAPPPPPEFVPENDGRLYMDENIQIGIRQYREYETDIYVADVKVSSLAFLQTAFAHNTYGRNVKSTTSDIAREFNAIFAVNGDFYGAREHGYVVRNGVLYRDEPSSTRESLMIKADSTFEIVKESETSAQSLVDAGAYQVLSFGPGLVKDGNIAVTENDEVAVHLNSNPRTAIGFIDYNHFVFVVSDGRVSESAGLSLYQLANFIRDRGAVTAYNLDGGGSSCMYFQGEVINRPTNNGRDIEEREVSDIVYIGY